jgi:hypothetical protein
MTEPADTIDAMAEEIEELRAEVRRLREALTWQPIETAPKDGTWVIVLMRNGQVWKASWGRDRQNELHWCTHVLSPADRVVTHWMPLPAPAPTPPEGQP